MFTLSAFADEISPDPAEQVAVLEKCGVRHIELRSILKTNVLDLTDLQVAELKALLDRHGFRLSAIGSPLGKTRIDEPFDRQRPRLARAFALAQIFDTPNIRIFSFYPPEGQEWAAWRDEVLARVSEQTRLAEIAGLRLLHENEHRIYGDSPERVVDLLSTIDSPALRAAYDPANYVFCGFDPWEGWQRTKAWTTHFHIKDWMRGEEHGQPAGEGQGRIPEVMTEAVSRNYEGFATLEPHLLGGGPTGGVTGAELFPNAVTAFTKILDQAGARYQ